MPEVKPLVKVGMVLLNNGQVKWDFDGSTDPQAIKALFNAGAKAILEYAAKVNGPRLQIASPGFKFALNPKAYSA